MEAARHVWKGGCGECTRTIASIVVVLAILVIAVYVLRPDLAVAWSGRAGRWSRRARGWLRRDTFVPRDPPPGDLLEDPIDALIVGGNDRALGRAADNTPERESVFETMNRFYVTSEVDPLLVGQGYEFRDNTRDVYAGRTGDGGLWGLQEFAVDNQPGMVGVDVGPDALSEYEGSILGYNDGIPEQWAFPATPIRWYRPRREDYFGHEGPAITNEDKLYPLFVPDHEPLIGADTEPKFDDN